MANGNRPAPEFWREAVRSALTSGRTRRGIAKDLNIKGRSYQLRDLEDTRKG